MVQKQKSEYNLSVVIPAYNLENSLATLFIQLDSLDPLAVEIIFIDDASNDNTLQMIKAYAKGKNNVTCIKNKTNLGAGVARNKGFASVNGKYTYFFDGDDILHVPALMHTIEILERTQASVSLHSYKFFRGDSNSVGMNAVDVSLWQKFYPEFAGQAIELNEVAALLEFTNYPWNKVIKTEDYKNYAEEGLFGETTVNNDILGHWKIMLSAKNIILIDEPIASHVVAESDRHLSNKFGLERLQLFDALEDTRKFIENNSYWKSRYCHVYWSFVMRVSSWARAKLDENIRWKFDDRCQILLSRIKFQELNMLEKRNQHATLNWVFKNL